MRRPTRAVVAACTAVLLLTLTAPLGPAQAQPRGGAEVRLVVAELTGTVGPGARPPRADAEPPRDFTARVLLENRTDRELDDLRLVVEAYGRLDTRSELRVALEGGEIASSRSEGLGLDVRDGGVLGPGEIAGVTVTITGEAAGWTGDESHVHPLQLTVLRGTQVLDQVRTAVVYLAAPPTGILETTLVWPLDTVPWRGPGGRYAEGVDAEITPGGRLDRLLRGAEANDSAGILLAPAPHLLEDLLDRADGFPETRRGEDGTQVADVGADAAKAVRANDFLRRIRELAGALPFAPVVGPYADADVAGLVAAGVGLAPLAGTELSEGRRRLERLLDRRPDATVHLSTTPLSPRTLDLIPAEHLLMPWSQVVGPDLDASPATDLPYALRQTRTPAGRPITATVADPWVSQLLTDVDTRHGVALAAHRVVVETAGLFLRAPGTPGRPLLILPPLDWDPEPLLAEQLLTRLRRAEWLRLTDATAQLSRASQLPIGMDLAGAAGSLSQPLSSELRHTLASLDAARTALPADATQDEQGQARLPIGLEDNLLRAASIWWSRTGRVDQARLLVADVESAATAVFGEVVIPESGDVTMTSDRGTIPVTLQRTAGGPVLVRVEVDSRGALSWPEGDVREDVLLTPDSAQTVSFETLARSRGTFPVTITVTDSSGLHVLDQEVLSVRSTAISGPALAITGIIVGLLLLRGLRRRSDRRAEQRPPLEVVK